MAMKLQIFLVKKVPLVDSYHVLAVINLNSALKKDDSFYPKVFLKSVIRNINDNLSDFSCLMILMKNRCFFNT